MRRISDLLGKPIRLEADFDDVFDHATAARQLSRWGISRVYGALALACLDDELRLRLCDALHTVRLKMGHDERMRFASFDNGVLEVGVRDFLGEQGCFYEYQLLAPLTGEALLGDAPAESFSDEPDADEPSDDETEDTEAAELRDTEDTEEDSEDQPEPADVAVNEELFTTAVESLRQNGEPAWRQQLELALGRSLGLTLDYAALRGNHDLVMPFIHQSLTGALGGLSILGFDPDFRPKLAPIQDVFITTAPDHAPVAAAIEGALLRIAVPLAPAGPPAIEPVAAAIRAALAAQPPAAED
jgi:hypothetical protein